MERIPVLEVRITSLERRIDELHMENKEELRELKAEHISDIRKNVCRLWMAFDEMRLSVNKICLVMEGIKVESEMKRQVLRVTFILLGASIGALATIISKKYL